MNGRSHIRSTMTRLRADLVAPLAAYAAVRDCFARTFFFEERGDDGARRTFICAEPLTSFSVAGDVVTMLSEGVESTFRVPRSSVRASLQEWIDGIEVVVGEHASHTPRLFGFIGYRAVEYF